MIHRALFRNFKALRNVDITFDSRLTVLVGPNGSGKTSVLQGINFLTEPVLARARGRSDRLEQLASSISIGVINESMLLRLESKSHGGQSSIIAVSAENKNSIQWSIQSEAIGDWSIRLNHFQEQWHRTETAFRVHPLQLARLDIATLLQFNVGRLASPKPRLEPLPEVGQDGSGLALVLGYIEAEYPERYKGIMNSLTRIIPPVTGLQLDKDLVPEVGYYADSIRVDYQGATGVKLGHVSSGTLFALGLLAVAYNPNSPNILLLDDLENGLHPKAQMELVAIFRSLLEDNPSLQIIATSHSPYILDRLEWNEVKVTALQDDGTAVCVPLIDHPLYPKWHEAMTPGEFWSHLGDDWVKKADVPNPSPEPVATP